MRPRWRNRRRIQSFILIKGNPRERCERRAIVRTGAVIHDDLSELGLDDGESLNDDGTDGDAKGGDGIFSLEFTVPAETEEGTYTVRLWAEAMGGLTDEAQVHVTVVQAEAKGGGGEKASGIPGFELAPLAIAAAAAAVVFIGGRKRRG